VKRVNQSTDRAATKIVRQRPRLLTRKAKSARHFLPLTINGRVNLRQKKDRFCAKKLWCHQIATTLSSWVLLIAVDTEKYLV